jgi:signal transduction histidine kinase
MDYLFKIVLENPMDLVLANKRSIKAGELVGLSISLQTGFSTAISEAARVVFDTGYHAELCMLIKNNGSQSHLVAILKCRDLNIMDVNPSAFAYAHKLVKVFDISSSTVGTVIRMEVIIPRSAKLVTGKVSELAKFFESEKPESFYEVIKKANTALTKEAQQKEEQLEEANLINSKKNEFLAIASHELKTPLAIIKGFSGLALMEAEEGDAVLKEYLRKIDQQASKLNNLVTQLLDISRIEAGQLNINLEKIYVNDYLREELASIKMVLPGHKLNIHLCEDVCVMLDRLRMEQVLSNLLANAAKYSGIGTTIKFSTSLVKEGYIRFSITDEGIGMSTENAQKVFEKFYRVEEITKKYSGLGMGLYIASMIISEHHGRIWLESVEGSGSTFYFNYPV